jgi:hypothetical protein
MKAGGVAMTTDFIDRYGPVAVITGASSGIGYAFAEELADRGLDLVVTARRLDRLEELAARLTGQYRIQVTPYQCNLSDPAAPLELLRFTKHMDVGLAVSNAGFGLRRGPHETHSSATLTALLMVNCNAPSLLSHGFIPRLRARGRGGIIFTSSVEGALPGPYSAAYSSSKALVTALGEALWGELAETEIDVLTLCPGKTVSEAAVKQGFHPSILDDAMAAREVARLALEHIKEGPTYISDEHYAEMIDRLSAVPRRQSLLASAAAMKEHMARRDANGSVR